MSPPSLSQELQIAKLAVTRAAKITTAVQVRMVRPETLIKKDRSPVTVADFASQAIVCATVHDAFPKDIIVGEEAADELREESNASLRQIITGHVCDGLNAKFSQSQVLDMIDAGAGNPTNPNLPGGRFWTLDPIDGTKGFLRGEQYVVALALIENGQVVLGALACPNLLFQGKKGVLFTAVRSQGAWQQSLHDIAAQPMRVQVNTSDDPHTIRFCEPVESEHADHNTSAKIAATLGIVEPALRMDSMAKYATVARGDATIYMRLPTSQDRRENIWDHAAGAIIVTEAGGCVSDVLGKPLDFGQGKKLEKNWGILATNGKIHPRVLAAISGHAIKV